MYRVDAVPFSRYLFIFPGSGESRVYRDNTDPHRFPKAYLGEFITTIAKTVPFLPFQLGWF